MLDTKALIASIRAGEDTEIELKGVRRMASPIEERPVCSAARSTTSTICGWSATSVTGSPDWTRPDDWAHALVTRMFPDESSAGRPV